MGGIMQKFNILLWKNFQVRKKHWGMSIFVQVIIPILLYALVNSLVLKNAKGENKNIPEMQKKFASKGVDIIQTTSIFIGYSINPTIGYTPQSDDTDKLMKLVKECVGTNTTGYQNETEMTDVIANNTGPIIGIVFKVDSTSNTFRNGLEYTLRAMPNKDDEYRKVQICLDISYIEMITNVSVTLESLGIKTTQMKTEVYEESLLPFDVALSSFCTITLLVFVITYSVEMVYIAKEKAVGINALMSLNGIKNWMNLLSWLVTGIIWNFLLLIPIVLMLKFSWVPESNAFMEKGNPILIFMAFSLHIVHLLCFGYHIASYFNKSWKGVVTSISFLCSIRIIKSAMEAIKYQETAKYLEIISPSSFLTGIFNAIERYERQGMTIGFMNMFSTEVETQPFETSIGMIMLFSILGAILHFFMALYIHAIKPGEYGVKRHPLAWFLKKKNITEDEQIQLDSDYFEQKKEFEKIPAGCLKAGVQIRKLKKVYSTGFIEKDEFHALKEVSIDFYRGEITALLGHNGAGKTTMMSILSGLTGSSGGVVIINGKNVLNNHDVISNNVGLCPQANITVPDLNVYQQVLFFAKLRAKNKTSAQIKEDVENLLLKVNLQDKKNCALDQLSGGQKRRLCLALAVIGDANVLIFDEPTSGIDTEGKRDIWDMILAMKSNKTILISTHDMEEADILGDRIAIMHSGKINSYGTSMFLKKLHADGQVKVTLSLKSSCDTAKILEIIGEDVKTLNQRNDSIVLAIPNSESLPETLDKLEFSKKKLGITGISASIITLEQIFVKVTEEVDHNVNGTTNEIGHDPILFNENKGFDYLMQTLWGYVIKKQAYAMRSPWSFLLRLILPCLIVVLIFLCSLSEKPIETVDLTLNEDSVSLYKKWKASEEMIITNRNYTNFAFGNERFITAEYNNVSNKTLNVKQLFYSDNQKDEISKTINFIDNTLLKIYSNNSDSKIQASKKDIYLSSDSIYQKDGNINMRLFMIIPVMVIMLWLIPFYISQPLCERKTGIKQLQDTTGASKIVYWSSMFVVDFVHYTISIIIALTSLLFIDNSYDMQIIDTETITICLIIMLLFGLAGLFEIYVFSLFNFSEIAAKIILIFFPFVVIILGIIYYTIIELLPGLWYRNNMIETILLWILMFIPQINLLQVSILYFNIMITKSNYLNFRIIKGLTLPYCLIIFVISFVLFIGIIYTVEQKIIAKVLGKIKKNNSITNITETDELVQKERDIVSGEVEKRLTKTIKHKNENVFLAHELRKSYGNLQVVKDISFRVKSGECFGLLGVNGAGKSTTFKMLTGEESACHGKMYLKDIGMHDNRGDYLSKMGYCPQHDALIETLNAWDHLYLFARLRGVPESQIKSSVEGWIKRLNLTACASRPSRTYSGGNKRRLNIALALIGQPSLVLMDEPTTGVDPAARRSLWNTLKYCQKSGQSIILTSHSMEECEALCNRLVIMVNGKLVCVGAVQELKQRFGAGYNIHVKMSPASSVEDVQHIKETIESTIRCQKMDENSGFLGYHVTDPGATWTVMYRMMNTLKNNYNCIEDFAVLSSTLEQLFIQFARAEHTDLTSHEIP